jgi:hypothetical protein
MKLSDISERAAQEPFRPFALETTGGSWIEVEKQSDIFLPARRPDIVIVFDSIGRLYILDGDQIAALESK